MVVNVNSIGSCSERYHGFDHDESAGSPES